MPGWYYLMFYFPKLIPLLCKLVCHFKQPPPKSNICEQGQEPLRVEFHEELYWGKFLSCLQILYQWVETNQSNFRTYPTDTRLSLPNGTMLNVLIQMLGMLNTDVCRCQMGSFPPNRWELLTRPARHRGSQACFNCIFTENSTLHLQLRFHDSLLYCQQSIVGFWSDLINAFVLNNCYFLFLNCCCHGQQWNRMYWTPMKDIKLPRMSNFQQRRKK